MVHLGPGRSCGRGYFYLPKNNRKTPIVRNDDRGLSRAGHLVPPRGKAAGSMEPARLMISESREGGTAAQPLLPPQQIRLAKFEAIRRASSRVSNLAADRRPGSSYRSGEISRPSR
jgi:hypothetical protein